jgi:hypothetical protein
MVASAIIIVVVVIISPVISVKADNGAPVVSTVIISRAVTWARIPDIGRAAGQ